MGLQLQHCTSGGGPHHPQPQQVMRRLHQWKHPLEQALEMRSKQPGLAQQHQHVQHAVHMHQNMTFKSKATRAPARTIHFKKCTPEFWLSRTLQYSSAAAPVVTTTSSSCQLHCSGAVGTNCILNGGYVRFIRDTKG